MFEMIIGIGLITAGAFAVFALSENIDEYMLNHNDPITRLN